VGLDAAVFRNIESLEQEFGVGLFVVTDPNTGETGPAPVGAARLSGESRFAQRRRIGNVAAVADLRRAVRAILPIGNSIVLEKVIFDGMHAGDQIELSSLPMLRAELEMLKGRDAQGILEFTNDMMALLEAAERERNPIVFL